ncbi:MAG: ABC transporter substrate-binding protein [Phascolarctobacterium sp.]|nr:ABC transporter substrate-binding protein [Phascolarctobacterium sp.]
MKKLLLILMCLSCLFLVSGCGSNKTETKSEGIKLEYTPTLQKYGFKEPVNLKKYPERVISLVHTPVLALHELGVSQVGVPANRLYAWPEELKKVKQFNMGMKANFDLESVVASKPDLVILPYQYRDKYGKQLEKEKIPVYYVDAGPTVPYGSVKELVDVLIKAFGKDKAKADALHKRFTDCEVKMAASQKANANKKVMVLNSAPPSHYLQTENGTIGNMAKHLGFKNVFASDKGTMVLMDREAVLSYNPDVILCAGMGKTPEEQQKIMEADFTKNATYWNQIKAIKEKKIIYLPIQFNVSTGIKVVENIEYIDKALKEKGF